MVLPAQLNVGLELTNIVNPISQAMSAVGNLALMDAIKRSGSDFITETKLASLIGRHRIDPVIEFHFREMVAKSDQSVISRYLDIVLESGSGPTVQEALKNPALFSMVIQLSGLAFAHEDESLANAIVDAIEKIVQESNGDVVIVPDYVSLLGTIRACQQQTAAFRWALLYEAAEEKIHKALADLDSHRTKRRKREDLVTVYRESVAIRSLPVPVLQGLLMWLQSLQRFPEHRLLHVICNTGISTVVVWCHHILGLSLSIDIQGDQIHFGDAPYNLVVGESRSQRAGVSLMDPLDAQEPLFSLQSEEHSMLGTSYEQRAEAYGYGAKLLQFEKYPEKELQGRAQWAMTHSIETLRASYSPVIFDADTKCPIYVHRSSPLCHFEDRILSAGRFLFALDEITTVSSSEYSCSKSDGVVLEPYQNNMMLTLEALIATFARIPEDDLARCRQIPLALNVPSLLVHEIRAKSSPRYPKGSLNLLESFKILSFMLLGRHMSHDDYLKPAVLVSAWGWSVFFDSIDPGDPFDVPVDTLRVVRGVPSRRGLRRTRIIDGPQRLSMPTKRSTDERNVYPYKFPVYLAPGVSTAEKGVTLVGHHSDAFQVTQNFTFDSICNSTCGYGLRKMMEWSIESCKLPPCQCDKPKRDFSILTSKHIDSSAHKISVIDNLIDVEDVLLRAAKADGMSESYQSADSERVFASKDHTRYFFYVSDNPAARWIQLEVLYNQYGPEKLENSAADYEVGLGGPDTCVECAVRNSESFLKNTVFLL